MYTAQSNGNEAEVGSDIAGSGVDRGGVFLTTKIWHDRREPATFRRAVEESLRLLRTDYVDLLLIHWPNPDVPLDRTLGVMAELQAKGKVRCLGVSNFTVRLMQEAVEQHGARIVNNQVEYHPFLSPRRVLEFVRRHRSA